MMTRRMFAAYDIEAIYGIGPTELDAINDAMEGKAMEEDDANALATAEMTPALAEQMINITGATTFNKLADGRLGTWAEWEAESGR